MKNYLNVFSHLLINKTAGTIFIALLALCVVFVSFPTAEAAAGVGTEAGAKYYLPTYFPASGPESGSAGLLRLEAPGQVEAGKSFVLNLSTGDGFPLLINEDAAFFESFDGGEPLLAGIATLDVQGTAGLRLQRTKAGVYHFSVLAGPYQSEITVRVNPGPPAAIKALQERLFLETGSRAALEFAVEDHYSNKIAAGSTPGKPAKEQLDVMITGPAGGAEAAAPAETKFSVTANPAGNFAVNFIAEKIGDYQVKASLPGGAGSARSSVYARELGAVTGLDLMVQDGEEPFLCLSGDVGRPGRLELAVVLHGENNLTKISSPAEERDIIFSTDRPDLLQVEKTSESKAVLTEKGRGGLAVATVTYVGAGKGLQKSIPIWIAGEPVRIKPEIQIDDLTARVQIDLVDQEGRTSWQKSAGYRLDTPPGIRIASKKEFARGKAEFVLEAAEYACYTVGITTGEGLSHSLKVDFLKKVKPARHAVIFIGQKGYIKDGRPAEMSPAPETSYGRVFVPVEFLSDAFGVEVSTFPGMEKIALQGPDGMKITIDQAAQQLTITSAKDGSTITTPIGTLFLQKKAGTYFVPAGIIARILGVEVDYLPKRDQIEHVTFIRK